jgi:polysaccharide pyruvyl transferase WcaK-like protein
MQAVRAADVVVAAGGDYVTDTFRGHRTGVLGPLSPAQRLGNPTAMFGQGVGPIGQRLWAAVESTPLMVTADNGGLVR